MTLPRALSIRLVAAPVQPRRARRRLPELGGNIGRFGVVELESLGFSSRFCMAALASKSCFFLAANSSLGLSTARVVSAYQALVFAR